MVGRGVKLLLIVPERRDSRSDMTRLGLIGMATIDTLLFGDRWSHSPDSVNIAAQSVETVGGKGVVAAIAAVVAGADVSLLSLVGRETTVRSRLPPQLNGSRLVPILSADNRVDYDRCGILYRFICCPR